MGVVKYSAKGANNENNKLMSDLQSTLNSPQTFRNGCFT